MANKTLLITKKNGSEVQIDIPEEWKVTFGPVAPNTARNDSGNHVLALRIYESNTKQRAIFTDVASFRDMSIPIREKRINIQEKHGTIEVDNTRKATTFQAKTVEWVNPDEEPEGTKLVGMPEDSEIFATDQAV